jgi:kynurenine formamidase
MPLSIIDLSHPLTRDTPVYPSDPPFTSTHTHTIPTHGYNLHTLSFGTHTGTHLDAPFHFFDDAPTVDQIPLEWLVSRDVIVVNLSETVEDRQEIGWDLLEGACCDLVQAEGPSNTFINDHIPRVVLVCTGWSKYWGTPRYYDHPFLSRSAAVALLRHGIRILGVDTLSPDQSHLEPSGADDYGVHEEILGSGGLIVENLTNLKALTGEASGEFRVNFVPMNVKGCDGAPVRAFAWRKPKTSPDGDAQGRIE